MADYAGETIDTVLAELPPDVTKRGVRLAHARKAVEHAQRIKVKVRQPYPPVEAPQADA